MIGKEKKKVLYYNDTKSIENLQVNEDIIRFWREVAVDGMDENKIDDYLEKQGIASMKDAFANNTIQAQTSKRKTARGRLVKKHNLHMDKVLDEYNPELAKKPSAK